MMSIYKILVRQLDIRLKYLDIIVLGLSIVQICLGSGGFLGYCIFSVETGKVLGKLDYFKGNS